MRYEYFKAAAVVAIGILVTAVYAQQTTSSGPYKVLQKAKVGGEGGWDYIYADAANRRLYIPRGAVREAAATETTPAVAAVPARLTIFDLDTLAPAGEITSVGGNGTAVDPKSGHGFTSDHPQGIDVRCQDESPDQEDRCGEGAARRHLLRFL